NFEQPCNIARYVYYKDKVARFQDAEKATKLDGFNLDLCYEQDGEKFHVVDCTAKAQKMLDEARNITEMAVFKQCGQCPVAFDMQMLMNEMLTGESPALFATSTHVTCSTNFIGYKSFTERLLTALGGSSGWSVTWNASAAQMDEELDSRYFEGSFSTNPSCSLRLQFPDGTGTYYNFSDILQFYTLKYDPFSSLGTQTNGSFTVIAVVKEPEYDEETARHLTKEIIMKGSFPCMDFANCSFKPICKASSDAVDLQNMFNNLLADKHPRGPSPVPGASAFLSGTAIDLQSPYLLTSPDFRTKFVSLMGLDAVITPTFTWRVTSLTNPSSPSTSGTLNALINGCSVQITFPVTSPVLFDFGDIVSFSNIIPDPSGSTASNFIITALVNDGTNPPQYIELKGYAYCLSMGSCSTELPYPYQMGKPEKEDLEYTLSSRLVNYLLLPLKLNEGVPLINDDGTYNGTTETDRCSVEFALPPIPGFTFSMVKKIIDVRPDKTSTGADRFIAYALLDDGRIVPLTGSTRSECYSTISACRFYEEVDNGTFVNDEWQEEDIHDYAEEDVCETNGMDIINGDYTVACEFIRDFNGHTINTSTDQFLLINTDPDHTKRKAWSQNISNLQIGREYVFKMYYMNANESPVAAGQEDYLWVEFLNGINPAPTGTVLKEKVVYDPESGWKEYIYTWKADASNVTINIYAEGNAHNFIAIDDISFGRSCPCIPTELLGNGYIDYSTSQPLISAFVVQGSTALADNKYTVAVSASTPDVPVLITDRTRPGQGKFMLFKIVPETTLTAYENTIPVEQGKEYVFNAWYFLPDAGYYVTDPDKLKITLKVNGQVVHELLNANSRNSWNSIQGRWASVGNTTAKVEVVLTNLHPSWGNKIIVALDDITLMRMCQPQFCGPLRELELPEIDPNPCLTHMNKIIELNAKVKYAEYLADVKKQFQDAYIAKCLQSYETFLMKYDDGSNHITLYYYDQAGNLVRTIPPAGVRALSDAKIAEVEQDRLNGTRNVFTDHTYATTYRYNSLNQLVSQSVPDNVDLSIWNHSAANSGISSGYALKGMSFSSKYGVTAGVESSAGKLYRTTNSGESWTAIVPELKLDNIIDLHMIDASNGIALASNGRYLVTNDGAATWEIRALPTTNDMVKMRVVGTSISACTTYVYDKSGAIWISTNLGTLSSYTVTTPLPPGSQIRTMNFYGSPSLDKGVAITTDNKIYYTINGGKDWAASISVFTDATLTELEQVNGYVYVATGKNGTLLRSSDKGSSWIQVNTRLAVDIKEVHFSTVNEGCMLDVSGNLYTTTDGGNNWSMLDLVKSKLNDDGPYTDLDFFNKNEGYAVNSVGQLLYTNNGGKGWVNRNNASALTDISALQALNTNELFFMGAEGKIYYSLNSGNSMVTLTPSSTPYTVSVLPAMKELHLSLNPSNLHYMGMCYDAAGIAYNLDVNLVAQTAVYDYFGGFFTTTSGVKNSYFINSKEGYVLFDNYASKTTDACSTWTTVILPSGNLTNAICMGSGLSALEGVIVGEDGIIYKTTDAGSSWSNQSAALTPITMNMVKGASGTEWIIVGDKGTYLYTTNSCSTWTIRSNTETADFKDLSINGSADVLAAGTGGTIKNTSDNGITWNTFYPGVDPDHDIQSIHINYSVTPYRGTATTTGGKIYNLHNTYYPTPLPVYGYDWDLIEGAGSSATLPIISYYSSTWLTAGLGGKIYKTANIATTTPVWAQASVIKLPELYDVKLVDEYTAYAVGKSGNILKTSNFKDAVTRWELQTSNTDEHLYGIDFFSQQGVVVGANGTLLRTANGGAAWDASISLGTEDLNDVSIYGSSFGYIVGNNKTIYKNTTNVVSGTWSAGDASSVPSVDLYAVHLVNKKYGMIAGESGTVCQVDNSNGANTGWTWTPKTNFSTSVSSIDFKDVYFRDYKTGYVIGTGGKLFKTADGDKFNSETTGTANNLEAIAYVDHKNIFTGGASGEVRKISDEKNLSSSIFYYDKLGRVVVSQNSKQREKPLGPYIYSYTIYDAKGRIIEVGEKESTTAVETTYENETGRMSDALYAIWLNAGTADKKTEVTRTYYDEELITGLPMVQEYLRNRVATITHELVNDDDEEKYNTGTHYSYDVHGNVKSLLQEFQTLPLADKFKRTDYEYDLVSGKVNKVVYQAGKADQFMHRYEYDEENKLTHVCTSSNGAVWEQDARYMYYRHGPLARAELGHDKVQGLDYAYTIQGWLKGVNSNTVTTASRDIGHDGLMGETANPNKYFAQDEIGYSLGYYTDDDKEDYTAINAPLAQEHFLAAAPASSSLYTEAETKPLFNGNISYMVTGIRRFMQGSAGPQAMIYSYDQLNRIRSTNMTNTIDMNNNQWGTGTSTAYNETFHYDGNGNITDLTRKNELGQLMDDLEYKYLDKSVNMTKNTNMLGAVSDDVGGGTTDIKSGQTFDDNSDMDNIHTAAQDNYEYDNIGNLVKDKSEEIAKIEWTVSGKIKSITRTANSAKPDLEFIYDPAGNRIAKIVKPAANTSDANWRYTIYVRDAQGNVLTTYERKTDKLVDYAALDYAGVNDILETLAGNAGFANFISQLQSGNSGFLNYMET
ncbi:MAG: YCF48-related protein, partial [Bacteroidota bacterium]